MKRYDELTLKEWVPNFVAALKDMNHPDPMRAGHADAIRTYVQKKFGADIVPLAKTHILAELPSGAARQHHHG